MVLAAGGGVVQDAGLGELESIYNSLMPMSETKPHQCELVAISQQKEKAFFALVDRLRSTSDPNEAEQLGDEVGRVLFGE